MSVFRLSGDNALLELKRWMERRKEVIPVGDDHRSKPREGGIGKVAPEIVKALCREYGIVVPVAEYRFDPSRRWRADYCWPEAKVLLEIDGGVWVKGRHVNPQGFLHDCEKLNSATLLGFRVLRYPPEKLSDAIASVRLLLLAGA